MSATAIKHERPASLTEALNFLQRDRFRIIAGGTDYYPSLNDSAPSDPVLDITAIDGLRGITINESGVTIGALCSWTDIVNADLPPAFRALQLAALEVGSVQIQNRATIAGNLCNASPAADGVPPLLVLDASVTLESADGTRTLPLAEFIRGNRNIQKNQDEILTGISIPAVCCQGVSDFLKLGARKYLVISIAMVACRVSVTNDKFTSAAISVGSCSETAVRLHELESALIGQSATSKSIASTVTGGPIPLKPIDDVRSTAAYRSDAAATLISRSLQRCIETPAKADT